MTLAEFRASLDYPMPPGELSPLATALWWDGRGDWGRAHKIAQDIETGDAARIHAYLHRKEGDSANAAYWYRQAGESVPRSSLAEEWASLVLIHISA